MSVRTPRVTAVVATILAVTSLTACSHTDPTPADVPASAGTTTSTSTTVATTATLATEDPKGRLTEAEHAWIDSFTALEKSLDKAMAGGGTEVTKSSLLVNARALRTCSTDPANAGSPSQRLQPAYKALRRACAHFDESAQYAKTASALINIPLEAGSPQDRKRSEAFDGWSAGITDGSTDLANASTKAFDVRVEAGDV